MLPDAASRMISFFHRDAPRPDKHLLLAFQLSGVACWLFNPGNTAVYLRTPLAPETACLPLPETLELAP